MCVRVSVRLCVCKAPKQLRGEKGGLGVCVCVTKLCKKMLIQQEMDACLSDMSLYVPTD